MYSEGLNLDSTATATTIRLTYQLKLDYDFLTILYVNSKKCIVDCCSKNSTANVTRLDWYPSLHDTGGGEYQDGISINPSQAGSITDFESIVFFGVSFKRDLGSSE